MKKTRILLAFFLIVGFSANASQKVTISTASTTSPGYVWGYNYTKDLIHHIFQNLPYYVAYQMIMNPGGGSSNSNLPEWETPGPGEHTYTNEYNIAAVYNYTYLGLISSKDAMLYNYSTTGDPFWLDAFAGFEQARFELAIGIIKWNGPY